MLFLIENSDGDTTVEPVTDSEVKTRLLEGMVLAKSLPVKRDTNYWPDNVALLIRGSVVRADPIETVSDWKLS